MHVRPVAPLPTMAAGFRHVRTAAAGVAPAPALAPAGSLSVVLGPSGPVLTLWRNPAIAGGVEDGHGLYHRLGAAEAERLVCQLGAWLAAQGVTRTR